MVKLIKNPSKKTKKNNTGKNKLIFLLKKFK